MGIGALVVGLSLIDSIQLDRESHTSPTNDQVSTLPEGGEPILGESAPDSDPGASLTSNTTGQASTLSQGGEPISRGPAPAPKLDYGNQPIWIMLTGLLVLILTGTIRYVIHQRSRKMSSLARTAKLQSLTILPSALTQHIKDEVQVARIRRAITTGDYFPVTRRQMKQSWRYLRRMVREGPPTELDMDATVQAIGRQGMMLKPVFVPRRINRARVILLLDQEGSMAPFHGLSQRLVETAYQGGRLTPAGIYYFHNCPMGHLYHDPDHQHAESIDQVLNHLKTEYTSILIFSDAGAARSRWNPERLRSTQIFLNQLKHTVRYIVWLNPMPRKRWSGTTAEPISSWVPMFELDRRGLDTAIRVLRGQLSRNGETEV